MHSADATLASLGGTTGPVATLLGVRKGLDALENVGKSAIAELMASAFQEALRLESDPKRRLELFAHPDWQASRVPTQITERGDFLRLAVRFAVGLSGTKARSKANKYYRGMRPYFIRREPIEVLHKALSTMGVEQMAREGAFVGTRQLIEVQDPTPDVLEKLYLVADGCLALCFVRILREEGRPLVLSLEWPEAVVPSSATTLGQRRLRDA